METFAHVSSRKDAAGTEHGTSATYQRLSQLCGAVIVYITVMTPQVKTGVAAI
jgi:hypothetical protein